MTLSAAGAVRTADNTARILGVGGIVIGALSLLMSALGLRRPRGRPAAAAGDPVTP